MSNASRRVNITREQRAALLVLLEPDQAPPLADLRQQLREDFDLTEREQQYIDAAQVKDGEVEIDGDSAVSISDDNGAYVMAWVWVSDDDAGVSREGDAIVEDIKEHYENRVEVSYERRGLVWTLLVALVLPHIGGDTPDDQERRCDEIEGGIRAIVEELAEEEEWTIAFETTNAGVA